MTLEQIQVECSTMNAGETKRVDLDEPLKTGELLKLAQNIRDKMPKGLGVILEHVGDTIYVSCSAYSIS